MDAAADSPESLAAWLKSEALAQGFHLAGITTPDPPPHLDRFAAWLAAGRHGEMGYLASERGRAARADPRLLLPDCRSILVLAVSYAPPVDPPGPARVAAYARGDDYHDHLPPRAASVTRRLSERIGRPLGSHIYTDTGPLLERELAQRAGLGWIGKNTCLIHPRLGSMTLLLEILLDLELPPDPPFEADRCGSCSHCIEACPAGCILPDRTIDARRCISYLTIESRHAIPPALRPSLGGWVFGCDACQRACPWNQHATRPDTLQAFAPRPALDPPDLAALLASPSPTWLRASPLKRARRSGLARNTAVAAGNLRSESAIPALGAALLGDPDAMVRGHAAWALGRFTHADARGFLLRARAGEKDPSVLVEIDDALQQRPIGSR